MVFESIVAYFLDKYLSNYLENFDSSKLKIGIWNGDVTLENLYLKSNALDELNLPIKVVFGHLKNLKMKIPWKSLYTESVKVTIDGLTILIAPKSSIKYDDEREKKEARDNKLNEVKRLIELEKEKSKKVLEASEEIDKDQQKDTFSERIQMQIIRNLELEIKNIHIRYEDNFSKPDHPFSAGVTLNSIEIRTTDENWNPTYLKEERAHINKIASLVSLAIYCNSDDKLLNKESKESSIITMQNMIKQTSEINYILRPLSLSTKAVLNMKPKQDNFKIPMFDLTIILETIGLNLNRLQYFDLVDMLNTIDLMVLNAKYQKYRPSIVLKGSPKKWWLFAYTAIMETQIKPRREQFKWERIKLVTNTRKDYVNILKKKLQNIKLTDYEAETEKKCEDILDVFNMILARKQADVEIARVTQEASQKKSSWWGWSWSTSSSAVSNKEDQQKINEALALSQEEKVKLYEAIGYTEEKNFFDYPREFINIQIKFLLKKFEIKLIDGEYRNNERPTYISKRSLLHLEIDTLEANIYQFPVVKGLKISSSVKSILLTGSSIDSLNHSIEINNEQLSLNNPILIEPEYNDKDFIHFIYDLNPLDDSCNKRLVLEAKSLKFVYHAISINNISYFFRSSESIQQNKLKKAALRTISQVKERSILFMKNNLQNIQQMDLNINIYPSYLLVPCNGVYTENTQSLCVNFGHLSFKSEPKLIKKKEIEDGEESFHSATSDEEEILHEASKESRCKSKSPSKIDLKKVEENLIPSKDQVIEASYWKYEIFLKQIQIVLIENQNDLRLLNTVFNQAYLTDIEVEDYKKLYEKCYILSPLDLLFNIHQCVYTDDIKLPAWKVFGNLPLIDFTLTDFKLEQIIRLFLSIPLPKSDRNEYLEVLDTTLDDALENNEKIDKNYEIQDLNTKFVGLNKPSTDSVKSFITIENLQQSIILEFSFEINEINFKLKEKKVENFDWILFKINSFGTFIQLKTYDNYINVYLNQIKCEYGLFNDINGNKLYLISSLNHDIKTEELTSSRCDLIDIKLTQTDHHSPTLNLLHDNVLLNLNIQLCAIDLVFNVVAIKNILNFVEKFEKNINAAKYSQYEIDIEKYNSNIMKKKNQVKSSSQNQPLLNDNQIKYLLKKQENQSSVNKKKILTDSNLTEMKINAKFDGIQARICTTKKNYFQANINNFVMSLLGKPSQLNVEFSLNSINVHDLSSQSIYNKILSLKEDHKELINVKLTLFLPQNTQLTESSLLAAQYQKEKFYFKNYLDEQHFDLIIEASISKLRLLFLYKHLNTLLALLKILDNKPSEEKSKMSSTKNKLEEENQEMVKSSFEFLYKVKLDVFVNAPLIILPENSTSLNAILLDCGLISIKTNLDILKNYYKNKDLKIDDQLLNDRCELPPVIEVQKVILSNMEVSRAILNQDLKVQNELFLVDCSELKVVVRRNLQPNIFSSIEPLYVEVIYGGLLVSIARSDYSFIIQLLQNLNEKIKSTDDSDIQILSGVESTVSKKSSIVKMTNLKEQKDNFETNEKQIVVNKQKTISKLVPNISVKLLIESIRMYLHDEEYILGSNGKEKRSTDNAFSKMEIKNLQLEFNMFDDTENTKDSIKVIFLFDRIILDDTRKIKQNKKPIRLIEKYCPKNENTAVPMVSVTFEDKRIYLNNEDQQNADFISERNFDVTLSWLRLCVNVDYLLILYDFFVEGLPKNFESSSSEIDFVLSEEEFPKKNDRIYCNVKVENPQFILYENQFELQKSNSLIIDGMIFFRLSLVDKKTKICISFNDFMMRLKSVKAKRVLKSKSYLVLVPTSFNLTGIIEEDSKISDLKSFDDSEKKIQSFILDLQDIYLNLSPQMLSTSLKMLNSIQNSINERFKTETINVKEETKVEIESLFQTIAFDTNNFWFTQNRNGSSKRVLESTSNMSLFSDQSRDSIISSATSQNPKSQMIIRTSKIIVKLEAGLSEQIPLLGINLCLNGELSNWTIKPILNLTINCEMAYFNEQLSVWEPVIEPVEIRNDQLQPYELIIDMITNIDENSRVTRQGRNTDLLSHMNNLKPIRTFQIRSITPLQFVITKTFLTMLDTVNKTFIISYDQPNNREYDHDDYDTYEKEEDLLLEQYQEKMNKRSEIQELDKDILMDDLEENTYDKLEENPSFNFLIKNELGFDVSLEALTGFRFQNIELIDPNKERDLNIDKIVLKNKNYCPISLESDFMGSFQSSIKALEEPERQRKSMKFKLDVLDQNWTPIVISMGQSDLSGYYLSRDKKISNNLSNETLIICQTITKLDKRRIYLRSPIQIINTLNLDVDISYPISTVSNSRDYSFSKTEWGSIILQSGKKWSVPIEALSETISDFVKISPISNGDKYEKKFINWTSNATHKLLDFENQIFIQVLIEKEPINIIKNNLNSIDFVYNLVLLPVVRFYNYLPYPIKYEVLNYSDENSRIKKKKNIEKKQLQPGNSIKLVNARIGSFLIFHIENYAKSDWHSSQSIEFNNLTDSGNKDERQEETNMIEFRSDNGKIITLFYNFVMENHCVSFTLYAPYWILNQTKLQLEYKFQGLDDELNDIDSNFSDTPLFLKINSKFYSNQKKQILFRVKQNEPTQWSNSFLIDAIGNNGTITTRSTNKNGEIYEIGVDIKLSSNGLSKIIKLTPYYLLINNTQFLLDIREISDDKKLSLGHNLNPNTIKSFWPSINFSTKEKNCLVIRPLNTTSDLATNIPFSKVFWYNSKHSTVLLFENNPYVQALCVECIPSEEIVRIVFKPYEYGMAPVLILNCLNNVPVVVKQNGEDNDQTFLMPDQYHLKTWFNPIGKRELSWSCGKLSDQIYNLDTLQSKQEFEISPSRIGYTISFLDGLQKVLIFVESLDNLNDEIVGFKEIFGDEFVLNLSSISLSLVDNIQQIEILYMSVTSSSINWGQKLTKKIKVFKPFSNYRNEKLELAYQSYLQTKSNNLSDQQSYKNIIIDDEDEADFERMVLYVGKKEIPIERQYAPSLYINFFSSESQTTLHLKIHKLQIDSQLYDCVFPVVFSKVPPPKSLENMSIIKPLIELSMVQTHYKRTGTNEIKYFKVLIQEFFIKFDMSFLNAITEFITEEPDHLSKKYIHDSNQFFEEISDIKKSFHDLFETLENINENMLKNQKIYFDYIHISPIKMHLSFSLTGAKEFKNASMIINNPFFKSIGFVLTDMQDVTFKLSYFEVKNCVYSWKELSNQAVDNYKNQVIKQGYILVFGLDVLGNPFGLFRGLAVGVESLFYEPYAGAVQGPGEFAEGVALGIRNLFGNTFGGAAGAMSKITGTLSKGLATLSMDKEFQKSRKKMSDANPTFLQNFGQNLVMGVVSGVAGIVEKPIEGAKSGPKGILTGIGKGILGVVTKPTAGFIDFTSQSLENFRKAAVQEESIERVRPPRCIYQDQIIRPYKYKEAHTVLVLKSLEKGLFVNDRFKISMEITTTDPKMLLVATDRHIILVKEVPLFVNWMLEWSYELSELIEKPKIVDKKIVFLFRKGDKGIFSSKNYKEEKVFFRDEKAAKRFLSKIDQTMNEKDF